MRKFGPGFICYWHSSLGSIPVGYVLCNGENGTPDLLNRMIFGAGTTPVGETAGSLNHNHDFTSNTHQHRFSTLDPGAAFGTDFDGFTTNDEVTGTTDNESSLPPFHALLPIMEL